MTTTVLTVCAANVCRSPLAAFLLTNSTTAGRWLSAESAGTHAFPGQPMCELSAERVGADPASHRSRQLTKSLLDDADLVLPVDSDGRAHAARMNPACRPRMFTLRQAATLAQEIADQIAKGQLPQGAGPLPTDPEDRVVWLIVEMDAARGVRPGRPDEQDITDRHGADDHQLTIDEIDQAARQLAQAVTVICTAEGALA